MSAPDVSAILTGLGVLLSGVAAAGAWLSSWRNGRKLEVVHQLTNSLAAARADSRYREGVAVGTADEKTRAASVPAQKD